MEDTREPPASPGDVIDGRFRVRREIARGGMAAVLEAEHVHLRRRVALKLVMPELRALPGIQERLLREGRALEMCRGPNVVDVIDAGVDPRGAYIALEMLDGKPLDALMAARGRLSTRIAVALALQICDGLAAVHRAGVVHRDIKPSNVFVARHPDGEERAKLVDFGIARFTKEQEPRKLTQIGERIGTFDYMAPEQQLARDDVDHRADIYALGVTLYEMLTGDLPFPGGPTEVLAGRRPRALAATLPNIPPALDQLLARTLAAEPAARPQSVDELARSLLVDSGLVREPLRLVDPKTETPPEGDARRFARAPYVAPIRITDLRGVSHYGQTTDVSETGLLVFVDKLLVSRESVSVRFCLPVSGKVVTTDAAVRWSREARTRYAAGLELSGLSDEALGEIRRLVSFSGV